jgi:poly(ADP-ribose)glycohydrolase PARG
MELLLRRDFEAAALVREHPPVLRNPNKQLVFELCVGASTRGPVALTRWRAGDIAATWCDTEVVGVRGHYVYDADSAGTWHVNFADPHLFCAYGSALLSQDELQAAEHPVLGSIREALVAAGDAALTEEAGVATPVLVAGVERRCAIDTNAVYGNRFAAASAEVVRRAVRRVEPPTHSNLIAIAAPAGGDGPYQRDELVQILVTAYTGFAAAVAETQRLWPGTPTEIRTGFWGCGAFGGNRHVMTILQLAAARLAGAARLRFYAFDDAGQAIFDEARAVKLGDDPIAAVLERHDAWGTGDGT